MFRSCGAERTGSSALKPKPKPALLLGGSWTELAGHETFLRLRTRKVVGGLGHHPLSPPLVTDTQFCRLICLVCGIPRSLNVSRPSSRIRSKGAGSWMESTANSICGLWGEKKSKAKEDCKRYQNKCAPGKISFIQWPGKGLYVCSDAQRDNTFH